jgi:hypothetical protein
VTARGGHAPRVAGADSAEGGNRRDPAQISACIGTWYRWSEEHRGWTRQLVAAVPEGVPTTADPRWDRETLRSVVVLNEGVELLSRRPHSLGVVEHDMVRRFLRDGGAR